MGGPQECQRRFIQQSIINKFGLPHPSRVLCERVGILTYALCVPPSAVSTATILADHSATSSSRRVLSSD